MKIPTNLKHKPVIVAEDYAKVDGKYAYETDVQGMSAGLAQWNDRGKVDISANKYGDIPDKNGPVSPKSFPCTVCWTSPFLYVIQ